MKMELLYEFKFQYSYKMPPITFSEQEETQLSQHYFEIIGDVAGKIDGKFRGTNQPLKRPDNIFLTDMKGVIETDDGAFIYLDMKGYGAPIKHEQKVYRSYMGPLKHLTNYKKYKFLNTIWCIGEGEAEASVDEKSTYSSGSSRVNVYALHWEPLNK